jgi:AhpC/TSA family
MDKLETGTAKYMSLYPEDSTDGGESQSVKSVSRVSQSSKSVNLSSLISPNLLYRSFIRSFTALRLGNIVPDFSAETTQGHWDSFHEWKRGKWAILFSHPADFTPVCTTEIGRLALKYDELIARDCLVATLSVDPVKSHHEWLTDVVAHCENHIEVGVCVCVCMCVRHNFQYCRYTNLVCPPYEFQ